MQKIPMEKPETRNKKKNLSAIKLSPHTKLKYIDMIINIYHVENYYAH